MLSRRKRGFDHPSGGPRSGAAEARRLRARLELVLAAVLGVATATTLIWPTWIESLTGLEPDGGSGAAEWGLVAVLAVCTVVVALLGRRDLRLARLQLTADPGTPAA